MIKSNNVERRKSKKPSELTPLQFSAIRRAAELGRHLQESNPEIAAEYRQGVLVSKIVEGLDLCVTYNVSLEIAMSAINFAVTGYEGSKEIIPYKGLIEDPAEIQRLALEHQRINGRNNGRLTYSKRTGIHGKSPEERSKYGVIGGKVAGRLLYEQKRGVHARTLEQMQEDGVIGGTIGGRIGGRKSAISRGLVPWKEEGNSEKTKNLPEIDYATRLAEKEDYHIQFGFHTGHIDWTKITEEINQEYHQGEPVRTNKSVKLAVYRLKKK